MAVVFRRGPSDWVQLIKWRTDNDTFEHGHWFHGRIYERRSDLSPDGSLLIYFAQKLNGRTKQDKEYTYAWTAISKPPYLTALALWPKGNCWHGGGLFQDDKTVLLNHRPQVAKPHADHEPRTLHVILRDNVQGEDEPIFTDRLERDGWRLQQKGKVENPRSRRRRTVEPEILEKSSPGNSLFVQLRRSVTGYDYSEEFVVGNKDSSRTVRIERAGWVDWDQQGRLVYTVDGKIMAGSLDSAGHLIEDELLDLNRSTPTPLSPPDWVTSW